MFDRTRSATLDGRSPFLALAVVLALVVAACGGSTTAAPSSGPDGSTAPSADVSLESTIDMCEDVANIIERITIKHA